MKGKASDPPGKVSSSQRSFHTLGTSSWFLLPMCVSERWSWWLTNRTQQGPERESCGQKTQGPLSPSGFWNLHRQQDLCFQGQGWEERRRVAPMHQCGSCPSKREGKQRSDHVSIGICKPTSHWLYTMALQCHCQCQERDINPPSHAFYWIPVEEFFLRSKTQK